jgi:type IV pilus modification protein PilV
LIAAPEGRAVRRGGFGLIEVLAALAISATGLLGAALVLRHCLVAQGSALRREQATVLLAAIAEELRMNPLVPADYALPPDAPASAAPACAFTASCTPAGLAAADLAQWRADIDATLPAPPPAAAPATIAYAPGGPAGAGSFELRVAWG